MYKNILFLSIITLMGLVLLTTANSLYAAAGVTIPSSSAINVNDCTFNVAGSITCAGTIQTTSGTISFTGNWTNTGTFTYNTGTVEVKGTGTSIVYASNTFYNFKCTTINKTINFQREVPDNNYRTTVTNVLTLTGSAGNPVTLGPSDGSGSDQWAIHPAGTKGGTPGWTVDYVTVSDSINLNSNYINPDHPEGVSPNTTNWFTQPLRVDLVSFYAIGYFGEVVIYWKTATEYNNAGFNLYVSENADGLYTKINPSLIKGLGTATLGKEYSYTFSNVTDGKTYYFKLEDVEFNGRTKMHGPVSAHPGLDSDGDGMTDDWEIHYGLNPNLDDSGLDLDNDGKTNLEEFLAHTNPAVNEKENTPTPDPVQIIESDSHHIIIELNTSGFEVEDKIVNGKIYKLISIPEYIHGYTQDAGAPKLPVKGVILGIPQGVEAIKGNVEFEVKEYKEYDICPVPELGYFEGAKNSEEDLRNINLEKYFTEKFVIDESIYSVNKFYPEELVNFIYEGYLRSQNVVNVRFSPLQYNPVTKKLRFYPRIRVEVLFKDAGSKPGSGDDVSPQPIKENQSFKIYTTEEGVYRLAFSDLFNAGFSNLQEIDPKTIKMYNLGEEIPIKIYGEEDGLFDPEDEIVFYAEKLDTNYAGINVYWIIYGGGVGLRMEEYTASNKEPQETPNKFYALFNFEEDKLYWPDINGDENTDYWFFDAFISGRQQCSFNFDLYNFCADPACQLKIKYSLRGLFDLMPHPNHHTQVYLNDNLIDDAFWSGQTEYTAQLDNIPQTYLVDGPNTITVKAILDTGAEYDFILADYFQIEYWKDFTAEDNFIKFGYSGNGIYQFNISGFTDNDLAILDVSNPRKARYMTGFSIDSSNTATFRDELNGEKCYIVLTKDNLKSPVNVQEDETSDLKSTDNQADYIIITDAEFFYDVLPLAYLRESLGLKTMVVKTEDIYDEFNFGIQSPHAIKDFLKFVYKSWQRPPPTYVLLAGDASYDYKDNLDCGKSNFVPTYFTWVPLTGETGNDTWFVLLDGEDDLLPDMFIGRLPVRTYQELQIVVDKIMQYELNTPNGENWENRAVFVSDDDEIMFENISDEFIGFLTDGFEPVRLYFSSYAYPEAITQDIINEVDKGALILTYVGHGGLDQWANESVLDVPTIDLFTNMDKLPLLLSFTCEDAFYLHPFIYDCMAETFLKKEGGGAIATFASTGAGLPYGHSVLGKGLFEAVFKNKNIVLGSATTQSKVSLFLQCGTVYSDLIKTYTLFGDPALRLKLKIDEPAEIPEDPLPEEETDETPNNTVVPDVPATPFVPAEKGKGKNDSTNDNTVREEVKNPHLGFESIYSSEIRNYESAKEWRDKSKEEAVSYKLQDEIHKEKEITPNETKGTDKKDIDNKSEIILPIKDNSPKEADLPDTLESREYIDKCTNEVQNVTSQSYANNTIIDNLQTFDYVSPQKLTRHPVGKTIIEPVIKTGHSIITPKVERVNAFKPENLNVDLIFSKILHALQRYRSITPCSKIRFTMWERVKGFVKSVFLSITKRR